MPRKLPLVTPETAPFWQGGSDGRLHLCRCNDCHRFIHPPAPVCSACASLDVSAQPVSGRGTVASFTVNQQAWTPELKEPYVVALVEIAEQTGLRILTNIVGMPVHDVRIGMPVRVRFLQVEDVWLPMFEQDV